MKPEISKSARDLLAKQPAAEAHLSPDLLNGYVEQALSPAENTQVMTHLSSCVECREVVFLASGAAEEEIEPEHLVATVQGRPGLNRVPVEMVARQAGAAETVKAKPTPTRNWWKWAAPLAAIVIVGSTALLERDRIAEMMMGPPSTRMANVAAPAPSIPVAKTTTTPTTPQKQADKGALERDAREFKPVSPAALAHKKNEAVEQSRTDTAKDALRRKELESQIASNLEGSHADRKAGTAQATPPAASALQSEVASLAAESTSTAPNGGNDLTYIQPDAVQAQSLAKSSLVANDQAAAGNIVARPMARQKAVGDSHWRIGKEGQLERSIGAGTWTQKLASEEVTFRAVATVGGNVWAGGNSGALFHSSDGGDHFNQVVLAANGQTERGAIVSIHFDTVQQGSVTTDASATWTTYDGGQSWSKQ
jgi:hypothetical protein